MVKIDLFNIYALWNCNVARDSCENVDNLLLLSKCAFDPNKHCFGIKTFFFFYKLHQTRKEQGKTRAEFSMVAYVKWISEVDKNMSRQDERQPNLQPNTFAKFNFTNSIHSLFFSLSVS